MIDKIRFSKCQELKKNITLHQLPDTDAYESQQVASNQSKRERERKVLGLKQFPAP